MLLYHLPDAQYSIAGCTLLLWLCTCTPEHLNWNTPLASENMYSCIYNQEPIMKKHFLLGVEIANGLNEKC